jgi:hypothetical protein
VRVGAGEEEIGRDKRSSRRLSSNILLNRDHLSARIDHLDHRFCYMHLRMSYITRRRPNDAVQVGRFDYIRIYEKKAPNAEIGQLLSND